MSVSCIILTKNEESNIGRCLDSLSWCSDIHVVDSGSKDMTCEIASKKNAYVYHKEFQSFAKQRNWALENCDIVNNWILFLDADECSTEEFRKDILKATTEAHENIVGFYCCWKLMLGEIWLKRSDSFPKWQFRLLKKGKAKFRDVGHGQKEHVATGELGYVNEPYLHFSFSKGWDEWWNRHRIYAVEEAEYRSKAKVTISNLFARHSSIRKTSLKIIASRVPGWPIIKFVYDYLFAMGFLDGVGAYEYCKNKARFEFLIQQEIKNLSK